MKDKNKKMSKKAWITISVLSVLTITIFALGSFIFGEGSVFNKTISSNQTISWLYNKIPALLRSIQIVTLSIVAYYILTVISKRSLRKSPRGATILKLITSFMKYLIAIIAILWILSTWGVDTGVLLASAGIAGLVVSLGAQSLIADIIAGMFIVFEGEFEVGDIVIIDGWRGTVDEIGIRTTKVVDWQGNIKIVNNSVISSVINQSKELSVTTCVVSLDYRESIPRVELVLEKNMERIKKAIPEIIEGPFYKGVDSLGDSSVNLLFIATVKESDYYVVQRALNREIKLLFDENNISIPFPQVTINQPEEFDSKLTKNEMKKAGKFAKSQSEAAKDYEDSNK